MSLYMVMDQPHVNQTNPALGHVVNGSNAMVIQMSVHIMLLIGILVQKLVKPGYKLLGIIIEYEDML